MSAQGTGATQQNTASLQAVAAALAAVTASMTALTNVVRASTQAAGAARGGAAGGGAAAGAAAGAVNPANGPVVAQFNEQRLSEAIMESRRGIAGGITGAAATYARAAGEAFAGPVGGAIAELAVDNFVTRGAINAAGSMAGAVANDMFRFGSFGGVTAGQSAYSAFGRVAAEIPFAGQAFQQTETAFVNARDRATGLMAPGASVGARYSDQQVLDSQVFFARQEGRVEAARIQQEAVSTANKRQIENAAAESYGAQANVLLSAKRVAFDAGEGLVAGGILGPNALLASTGAGIFTAGVELLRLTGLRS